jgi:phosphopantothenoylcysteine decarboxylase / phosphopantothenate---cysteine ligase
MKNKKILLAISGSIAAYKMPQLVRDLQAQGAEVQVMMTPSARDFVSPLVLGTLTKKNVLIDMFDEATWSNHVMLGRWADCILVAPASCNTIAKLATGQCDNFVLATILSATCPVLIAPAMDEDMYHHKATQHNLTVLKNYNYQIIDTEYGELASGLIGLGRLAHLDTILFTLKKFFKATQALQGITALVTAGPTYENLDPVRFIGNHSTGKMGIAIAETLAQQGATVHLILGPTHLKAQHNNITTHNVVSAAQMYDATTTLFPSTTIAVLSAAVADYTPMQVADQKIKKADGVLELQLSKTIDILKHLGTLKTESQTLVGFALETTNEKAYALKKLNEKNADIIILNSLQDKGAGFAGDNNKITIFDNTGAEQTFELKSKTAVAIDIVNKIKAYKGIL